MSRFPSGPNMTYSIGPGALTPAVKAIIYVNIAIFVAVVFMAALVNWIGLIPEDVVTKGRLWQVATYQFVHADAIHILINMLSVWMFGVDLERRWGMVAFTRYYLIVGITAGVATVVVSLLPFPWAENSYGAVTIGASGAVYGLMMAWAIVFPHRTVHLFGIFPLTARVFVLIVGALSMSQAMAGSDSNVAHVAHLGGLVAGWLYLKTPSPKPPRRRDDPTTSAASTDVAAFKTRPPYFRPRQLK